MFTVKKMFRNSVVLYQYSGSFSLDKYRYMSDTTYLCFF